VWLRVEVDGHDVPEGALSKQGSWVFSGVVAGSAPPAQPSTVTWTGRAHTLRVYFSANASSGRVQVTRDGRSREIDLYRPAGHEDTVVLNEFGGDVVSDRLALPHRNPTQWLAFAVGCLLLGALVVCLFDLAVGAGAGSNKYALPELRHVRRWDIVAFALPQLCIYLIYLLLFYPAIMTSDSLDQWSQSQTGLWNDWHPPLYAMMESGLRAFWNSPAIIALMQIVMLAFASGSLIAMARAAACAPRWAAYAGALLCAAFPVVAIDSITLWKDIPYSASVVFVTAMTIGVTCLSLPMLRKLVWVLLGFLAVVICLAFRYNGLPFLLASLLLIVCLAPREKWRAVGMVVTAMLVVYVFNGPVLNALGVVRTHASVSLAIHHIAAHQAAGEVLTSQSDRDLIRRVWTGTGNLPYDCSYAGVTIYDPRIEGVALQGAARDMVQLAVRLALAHPRVELRHTLCVSSMVWRLSRIGGEPIFLSAPSIYSSGDALHWIADNNLGLKQSPKLGKVGGRLRNFINDIVSRETVRRPAFFLYLLLFGGLAAIWRQRRWELGTCIVIAALAQSSSILLFNVAPDPRYQLSVVVMGLALAPLLLSATRHAFANASWINATDDRGDRKVTN
jgi:hypothetical protein